ncbi:MAG: glycosyltransferase [Candidatus Absconditabacteria bacterium]
MLEKKKRLLFINPVEHFVYYGWYYLFDKFYELIIYNQEERNIFGKNYKINCKKNYGIKSNPFIIFDKKDINYGKDDIIIIGDIFTNNLCFSIKNKNTLYYSEFFLDKKSLIKKVIFFIIGYLFYYNKKIIVPSKIGKNSFKKVSKNVFYLPQIYYGDIQKSKPVGDIIKLLFVGRVSPYFKNTDFMIQNYLKYKETNPNIHLTIVGRMDDRDFQNKYGKEMDDGNISYLGLLSQEELFEVYNNHDILLLCSKSEPIGSVVQEAMANGMGILLSKYSGSASYIEEGVNGYTFDPHEDDDFIKKLANICNEKDKINLFKENSYNLIKGKYWYKNDELIDKIHNDLVNFVNNG